MTRIPSAPYVRQIIRECPLHMSNGQWLSEEWGARVLPAAGILTTNGGLRYHADQEYLEFEDDEKAVLFILRFAS